MAAHEELPSDGIPSEGDLFDDKYRVGPLLGRGGMAAVIAARHLGLDEMVAIKVLLPECRDDPAVVERFVQEGRTAIKIRSEHVVRMLDVGIAAGRGYLVMEYLEGQDLSALLRDRGPLPLETAVDLLLQATEAIGEGHKLGIVHRDLKPANLFLTHRVDGAPCVKVLDFGISKMPTRAAATSQPTLASVVMGSPKYMSPEQMMSAATADERADIWSLGTILYELLSGQVAFDGSTNTEVCARVLQGTPPPLPPTFPREIGGVIARCLEKDRDRRYANVAELARALAPFGGDGARASATSIGRVSEGATDVPDTHPPTTARAEAARPTAAQLLGVVPKTVWRGSGYLMAAIVLLAALGAAGGFLFGIGPFRASAPQASESSGESALPAARRSPEAPAASGASARPDHGRTPPPPRLPEPTRHVD
jgi:serine/threonine-protein kinase